VLETLKPRDLTKIAVFAALYVVMSFIPVSMFIGAGSFLSLSLVITPVIAVLLTPLEALICSVIAGLILVIINPGAAMFGVFTLLLPISGSVCGSLIIRLRGGSLIVSIFLLIVITFYIIYRGSFIFWIIPHVIALILVLGSSHIEKKYVTVYIIPLISTICEQGAMLILAIGLLKLPVVVFQTAFPLMLYERTFATLGGTLLIITLRRIVPQYINL